MEARKVGRMEGRLVDQTEVLMEVQTEVPRVGQRVDHLGDRTGGQMEAPKVGRKVDRMEGRLVGRLVDQTEVPKVDRTEEKMKAKPGALVEVSIQEKPSSMEGRASPRLLHFQLPEPVLRRLGRAVDRVGQVER